jgi:hypothetical protein
MKQVDIYRLAVKLLRKMAKENPGKSFTNSAGEKATIDDVANELDKVSKWLYKDFHTEDIDKVVRCKKCKYYKKYKKKGAFKAQVFQACSKDMKKRDPMFFCKDGEERLEAKDWDNETD